MSLTLDSLYKNLKVSRFHSCDQNPSQLNPSWAQAKFKKIINHNQCLGLISHSYSCVQIFGLTNFWIHILFRSPILEANFSSGHQYWNPHFVPVTNFGSQILFRSPCFESHFLFRSPILKGGVWSRISEILELKDKYSLPRYATYHTLISNQNCIL